MKRYPGVGVGRGAAVDRRREAKRRRDAMAERSPENAGPARI